ncbi:MAG: hypothetical protein HQL64_02070 [Magnetococcales bacterium]|nr:hypothetical protein [Magnetococcales bacterium]
MIQQQVNLYQSRFHIKKEFLVARGMLLVGLLFILLLVVVSGVMNWLAAREESELQFLTDQQQKKAELLQDLTRKFPPPKVSVALLNETNDLRKERSRMRTITELLNQNRRGNAHGFSGILEALGREKVEGLWLDGIGIYAGGEDLALEGKARNADLVPAYLARLSRQKNLAGRRFSFFQMSEEAYPELAATATPTPIPTPGAGGPLIRFHIKTIDQKIRRDQFLPRDAKEGDKLDKLKEAATAGNEMRKPFEKMQENLKGKPK